MNTNILCIRIPLDIKNRRVISGTNRVSLLSYWEIHKGRPRSTPKKKVPRRRDPYMNGQRGQQYYYQTGHLRKETI